ncbi:MAG TPA: hypothetical protein GX394_02020 [Clostridiales bacterium]|jgi:vancomycin resistance protein YoaR|nr:hypothetical protein [Clostridiales bacterium]
MRTRRKRTNIKRRKLTTAFVFLLVLVFISGIGIRIYVDRLLNSNTIYEGITIDGLSMDGLTKESAERLLREKNQSRLDNLNIKLIYKSKFWTFGYEDIQTYIDIEEKVEEAYSIAREGTFLDRFLAVQKLRGQGRIFNTELTYNVDSLKDEIDEIASEINRDAVDATVTFNPEDKEMFIISPEKNGLYLDVDIVIDQIRDMLDSGNVASPIVLSPKELPPKVLARDFEGKLEKIASFGTDLSKSSEDRTKNVVTAALAFNGLVVSPGQTISFNETTGERTADKGYRYAPMIQNKRFVNVLGGGVSQTSTTLYNTVIRAGLDVVERTRHSIPSSYIDMGLDTTVNLPPPEPVIDLKFRNNRNSPIYIRAYYANKRIYFEVYGEPLPDGQRYEFYSKVYETIPAPAPEIIKDYEGKYVEYEGEEYVHTESRKGYKVRVYRQTFQNHKLIKEELFDTHFYRPVKGKTYIGTKKVEDTSA